jgi:signal transduction histidine kinase
MARLVDDLLDLSRIARGQVPLRRERLDLAAVVRLAVQTSEPLIQARNHRLTVSLPDRPLALEGDQARLVQVLTNLLNNAAKYTDPGGRIELSAGQEGDEAVVRVRDSGVGIPRDMLPRIFDLFMQVEGSRDRSQGGLGIGLALVRRLVELHGGTVSAHSTGPGRGSEFVVRLPLAPEPGAA